MVAFGQGCCIRAKRLYSGKVVVFGQKLFYSCKSGCICAKVVVFGQDGCFKAKVVVFRQKLLYST